MFFIAKQNFNLKNVQSTKRNSKLRILIKNYAHTFQIDIVYRT